MSDPNAISVHYGNFDQFVSELSSIIGASKATVDEYVARINATIMQNPENWSGPGGHDHWQAFQQELYAAIDRMHALADNARGVSATSAEMWPAIDQAIANSFS